MWKSKSIIKGIYSTVLSQITIPIVYHVDALSYHTYKKLQNDLQLTFQSLPDEYQFLKSDGAKKGWICKKALFYVAKQRGDDMKSILYMTPQIQKLRAKSMVFLSIRVNVTDRKSWPGIVTKNFSTILFNSIEKKGIGWYTMKFQMILFRIKDIL